MPESSDDRIKSWRQRWEIDPGRIAEIITCLLKEPLQEAARRITRLTWYTEKNGFHPLTFSTDRSNLILDLRGIPLRNADLKGIIIPFALLEGADFFKADLENANLSFIRAYGATFHQAHLEGVNLTAARLDAADFSMALLPKANLSRAHLEGTDLGWAMLDEAKLIFANGDGAVMERVHARKADFTTARFNQANLAMASCSGAIFANASFQNARFIAAHLEGANLVGANLEGADLSLAYLEGSHLNYAVLKRADLTRAHLESADLREADLASANLYATYLNGAGLEKARLQKTTLQGATLQGGNLRRADLRGANLSGASLLKANLGGADLREAELVNCQLRTPDYCAIIDDDTQFGWKEGEEPQRFPGRDSSQWLVPPLPKLVKDERKLDRLKSARLLCGQVRLLCRENGLFDRAGIYFEQENYWLTRIAKVRKEWSRYLSRLIFGELVTGYGQRPRRIALTGLILIITFAILFLLGGIEVAGRTVEFNVLSGAGSFTQLIADFWSCFLFSLRCFATLGLSGMEPAGGLSQMLASLEGLLGFITMAMGVVVFVRKMARN